MNFTFISVVEVSFVAVPDNVDEDTLSQTVGVDINRNILRDLVVSVSGCKWMIPF